MRTLALQANWIHPPATEKWLKQMSIGRTLNVCCGMSQVGDVRVDLDPKTNRTEEGDLFDLKFPLLSFDTVICDPPFEYYNKFRWVLHLSDLARKRLILSTSKNNVYLSRGNWQRSLWYTDDVQASFRPLFLRLFWVFDRRDHSLDEMKLGNPSETSEPVN